jgi:8-oxo-dGTP diphosphatase
VGAHSRRLEPVKPGVGCGAAILRDGRLLLVKRLKAPEAGSWNLPGGKIDFGERAADAVKREVAEELGVEIEVGRSLGFVEMIVDAQHWVSPIYQAAIRRGEPFNAEPEKHEGFVWADLADPPTPLAIAARAAIRALR